MLTVPFADLVAAARARSERLRAALTQTSGVAGTSNDGALDGAPLVVADRVAGAPNERRLPSRSLMSARGLMALVALGCGGCVPSDLHTTLAAIALVSGAVAVALVAAAWRRV